MTINSTLQQWMQGKLFWIAFILLGVSMEGVALFYQYVLDEPPCILCIHFRLLFAVIIIIALKMLWLRSYKFSRIVASLSLLAVSGVMAERSYQLLGTERRFILGECSMDLGFPAWLAVDKWVPWLFQPLTSCGYTPEIVFGITMAEALSVFSIIMVLFTAWMLFASLKSTNY